MIDVHLVVDPDATGKDFAHVRFSKSGESPDPAGPEYYIECLDPAGPYSKLAFRRGMDGWFWVRTTEAGIAGYVLRDGVYSVHWITPGSIAHMDSTATRDLCAAMRDLNRQQVDGTGSRGATLADSQLLLRAMTRGATLTACQEASPKDRLFGIVPQLTGYLLTLPDSSRRHPLGVDAAGLPVLDDDARQDLDRFLSK